MGKIDNMDAFKPLTAEELAMMPEIPAEELITAIVPVPEDAPPMRFLHPEYGKPTGLWIYLDKDKSLIGYIARFDNGDENGAPDKTYFPITYCHSNTGTRWRAHGFPYPLPLYKLPELYERAKDPVLVCQGEKTADAAARLFPDHVTTTSPLGAEFVPAADWSVLAGRNVIVAPDYFGKLSQSFVDNVCSAAYQAGAAEVLVLKPKFLGRHVWNDGTKLQRTAVPEGWDLADAEIEGWTVATIASAIAEPGVLKIAPRPLVLGDDGEPLFRRGERGVEKKIVKRDKNGIVTSVSWVWVCGPLQIVAEVRDFEGGNWGKLLHFKNPDGNDVEWLLKNAMLSADGNTYRDELLSLGLQLGGKKSDRENFQDYLARVSCETRARLVDKGGWHGTAYVTPEGTWGLPPKDERIVFQGSGHSRIGHTAGSMEGWSRNVAKLAAGNSRLTFAISVALAAPLINFGLGESGGFHLVGHSSVGKTTALVVAGSVWGGGGPGGYLRSWRATSNGLEGVAAAHNDCLLCLDEMGQVRGYEAGACAYMLANGVGKARATKTGAARQPATWRLLFLSTGEIGLADKIAEDGRERPVAAGQQVRIVDIDADAGVNCGIFENLHDHQSADALARHLRAAAETEYGHAGPAFVNHLAANTKDSNQQAKELIEQFVTENQPKGQCDGQVQRVLRKFGLVAAAGELAIRASLLPWPAGAASAAAARCFHDWLTARGTAGSLEDQAIVTEVRAFIEQHGMSRFAAAGDESNPHDAAYDLDRSRVSNRVGFVRKTKTDGVIYCFFAATWQKLWPGRNPKAVARVLEAYGFLETSDNRSTKAVRFSGKNHRCYVVSESILLEPPASKPAVNTQGWYGKPPDNEPDAQEGDSNPRIVGFGNGLSEGIRERLKKLS